MFRFVFAIFIDEGENFSHSNQIPVPDLCYPTNLNVCEEELYICENAPKMVSDYFLCNRYVRNNWMFEILGSSEKNSEGWEPQLYSKMARLQSWFW